MNPRRKLVQRFVVIVLTIVSWGLTALVLAGKGGPRNADRPTEILFFVTDSGVMTLASASVVLDLWRSRRSGRLRDRGRSG